MLRICSWSVQLGFGGRQISTVNASIATPIRARQPDQIGHRTDPRFRGTEIRFTR
jgi:hypothetical protein